MNSFDPTGKGFYPYAPTGSSLTSLVLAAVLPLLFLKAIAFFNHAWPNFVYRMLTSRMARQIATVEERVHPNRFIQDDIMIRSIMGYVSYCYLRMLRQGTNACDAVRMADYEYTFLYDNAEHFDEDWVPYSATYKTLFGRVIASAMELAVVPSIGQAIQIEPGLFVRLKENKHVCGPEHDEREEENSDGESDGESGRRARDGRTADSTGANQMDKLNQYAFFDMRANAENMDERVAPMPGVNGSDEASSAACPFDAPRQRRRDRDRKRDKKKAESSTCNENYEVPPEENILILEYRRPLPFEQSQALCDATNTSGALPAYDESRDGADVIESFLSRAHGWYLSHMAQRQANPLMAAYPDPAMVAFRKIGARSFKKTRDACDNCNGRCYVIDSASAAVETETSLLTRNALKVGGESTTRGAGDVAAAAAVAGGGDGDGAAGAVSTLSGGRIGLAGLASGKEKPLMGAGKTFKSLFFPAKEHVLSVVDDFVHERGCYGVPGVVPRLTFFLHGAPGTGKTSFVKALARHLRRDLVVISMGEVVSVDELQELLRPFDMDVEDARGSTKTYNILPHQAIYVFEDFDAIGDAWAALSQDQQERRAAAELRKAEAAEAGTSSAGSGEDGEEEEENEETDEESSHNTSDASGSNEDSKHQCASEKSECNYSDTDSSNEDSSYASSGYGDDSSSSSSSSGSDNFLIKEDEFHRLEQSHLTVEKFLDVFNGFNLSDSFIAVFTTNHPEKVHPLITSSNMMDVTLDMGVLNDACATEMVEHYYADELCTDPVDGRRHLSAAQTADLHAALAVFNAASEGLSGALLEKMCIECDTVELLTERLRAADSWDAINVF